MRRASVNGALGFVDTKQDNFCAGTKTIPDRGGLCSHKNDDLIFGAISITERRCAAPISNERGVTYRGRSHYIENSFRPDTKGYPLSV